MDQLTVAIWWVRRDLRLADNPALSAALARFDSVVPLFILDPALLKKTAEKRKLFLFAALRELNGALRERGSRLIVREGVPMEQLARVVSETRAEHIFAEADASPYARKRDDAIKAQLPLTLVSGATIHPSELVCKPDGNPYAVYTPFNKAWKALPFLPGASIPAPQWIPGNLELESVPLPPGIGSAEFSASENEALRRLGEFLSGAVFNYATDRNRLDLPGTARLSPYLRFGLISARQAAAEVMQAEASAGDEPARVGCRTWLDELIWREFYYSILYHRPDVLRQAYQPVYRHIPWRDCAADLIAWKNGLTGFPVVDACMRQLDETGWMHNRGRMIVASFLVKNLLINWQEGETWFMRHLVDGDPASNNGGWQWTAGVGVDAAPYFRIFNPVSQSQKHDPNGDTIRRYVPELRRVPLEYLHTPWLMPLDVQSIAGCRIGSDYPERIVDISQTRERAVNAFKISRQEAKT